MLSVILSVLFSRAVTFLFHLCGRGATTLPGRVALFLKYDILTRLAAGARLICVTGTKGKTTTSALLEHALSAEGKSYFINKSGANMLSGVTTAFLQNCTLFGKCRKDFAILECDENSMPLLARYLDAEVLAVTNLFRDQLDRYGEVTHTRHSILKGLELMPDAMLVLNADCPLTFSLSQSGNDYFTFGIAGGGGERGDAAPSDSRYCPRCGAALSYQSRVMAHLGNYRCPRCGFCRVHPDYEAAQIQTSGANGTDFVLHTHDSAVPFHTALGGVYNVYNLLCAAAVLHAVGVDGTAALGGFSGAFGRMERFYDGEREILLLLVKNPVGLTSCAAYAARLSGTASVILALNDNAADGRDVSWVWDADIDALRRMHAAFYTFGTRASDMALRLKYGGIPVQQSHDGDAAASFAALLETAQGNLVILANYTAMMKMRRLLKKYYGGKEFWQ